MESKVKTSLPCGCQQCAVCARLQEKAIEAFNALANHLELTKANSKSRGLSVDTTKKGACGDRFGLDSGRIPDLESTGDPNSAFKIDEEEALIVRKKLLGKYADNPSNASAGNASATEIPNWDAKEGCPYCHWNGPTQCDCLSIARIQNEMYGGDPLSFKSSQPQDITKPVTVKVARCVTDRDKIQNLIDQFAGSPPFSSDPVAPAPSSTCEKKDAPAA